MRKREQGIWTLVALTVLVGLGVVLAFEQHQLMRILVDVVQIAIAATVGLVFDHLAFARGGELRDQDSEVTRAAVLLRRGIVVGAAMMAVGFSI